MDNYVTTSLTNSFVPLLTNSKIRALQTNRTAVHLEVLQTMEYIQTIQSLIKRYKKPNSDYRGTAHRSSSLKKIVKTQINMLDDRLNGTYFRLSCGDEIEQTKIILRLLRASLEDEYKDIIEFFNLARVLVGLDLRFFDLDANEQAAIEQALDFHNGVRSSSYELVRSVMIFMDVLFDKTDLTPRVKAGHILDICWYFFSDELYEAGEGKNSLAFNKKHIGRPYRIKTILHQVPIFAYLYKDKDDIFAELMTIGLNGILGIQDVFEPDKPTLDEISPLTMARNIVKVRKEFGLTKKELRVLLFFLQ